MPSNGLRAKLSKDERVLAAATNPDGSQRFYPPYRHPATRQLQDAITRACAVNGDAEYVQHLRRELAKFEAIEDRAKRDYLLGVRK